MYACACAYVGWSLMFYVSAINSCSNGIDSSVCLCSPGLNMSKETDAKVIEHCSDADIFVYVCNGITTFETTVSCIVACIGIQPHYRHSMFALTG